MWKISRTLAGFALLALTGCMAATYGTAGKLNRVNIGMTKAEVVGAIGSPNFTSTNGDIEYLQYQLVDAVVAFPNLPQDYFVALRNDHVIGYGQKGDFNSTKNPTADLNIRQQVDVRQTQVGPSNAAVESTAQQLQKLFDLKQAGALTEKEYADAKAKILRGN